MNDKEKTTPKTAEDKAKAEAINELAKFAMVGHIILLTSEEFQFTDSQTVKWSYDLAELMYEARWK